MLYPNPNTKINIDKAYSPNRGNQGYLAQISLTFMFALSLLLAMFSMLLQQPTVVLAAGETCFATIAPSVTTDYSSADASAVQVAIDNASSGDLIKIAGTCTGVSVTAGITQTAYITKSLTLQGGYTSTNWTTQQPGVFTTTLDADAKGRVVYIASSADVTLDNLTLTHGEHSGPGAGIYTTGDITVTNNIIISNTASNSAGLYISGAHTGKISNSKIIDNHGLTSGDGGVIYNYDSTLWIDTVEFKYNSSNNQGGVLVNHTNATTVITNSLFYNNTARSYGGAIYDRGQLTITNSTLDSNIALVGSGGAYHSSGNVPSSRAVFINSTISYNKSRGVGGISQQTGTMLLINVTVSGNESTNNDIGGIKSSSNADYITITHSTISNNIGGDGLQLNSGSGSGWISNSIIDSPSFENSCGTIAGFTSGGYNISSDTSCTFLNATGDVTHTDPMLLPLADNGGPTWTHQLFASSPALNAIPNATNGCGNPYTTDQRGYIRPFGTLCDIGAYEAQGVTADVGLSKSVTPSTANVGDTITYTLTFSNSGDGLAQNVIITDEIPVEITNIISIGSGATITPTGGVPLAWMVEDLSAGESGTITLIGQVDPALILDTTVTNTAIITTSTTEASSANNIAQAALDIRPRPDLHLDKSVLPAAPVAGEQMTYTIQISNASNFPATGVIISDGVPSETTYVPGSITGVGGDATGDPNLVWNVGTVSLGNPLTVTFAVTINSNVANGTQIANTAAVSSSEVVTPVVGSAVVAVNQNVDLSISKSSQRENSAITYTLVISNEGPSAVSGAIVSDTIPAGIETASWMWQCASSGGASCSAGPLNTNINDTVNLPVGGQLIYTIAATLIDSTSTITNTATVTVPAGVTELTPADNTAIDTSINSKWFIYLPIVLKN